MTVTEILTPEGRTYTTPAIDRWTIEEIEAVERRLALIARALDSAFRIPGTGIRFGADTIVGFIPGVGDLVTQGLGLYIVAEAWRLGAGHRTVARMIGNLAIDTVVGVVPLVGDVADLFFRANTKNVALLREHVSRLKAERARPINPVRGGNR
ncbi:DUF4112 domain-containing protein [Chthonobacter albigriseus]|uniref:DUF4112 domain-containing protein n=1 Tax=Chthonobacter albigriseus TaxID=1683161 RepID=UPI0015EF9A76|nr:DUF4112 domain-containing protein [Chthonobacter albigriseus]